MTWPPVDLDPEVLTALVERSRAIGADPSLVIHGGGNTSAKGEVADHLGRAREVLWVKGSGADLAGSDLADYPGLWLDDLRALRPHEGMDDDRMTDLLRVAMVDPSTRRPSIETLLHAFLPYRHVDHVHADAIVALTKSPDAPSVVATALGERVAFVPWIRPGHTLARIVADAAATSDAVVLAHHGLVTWADDSDECLRRTRELVDRAEAYLAETCGSLDPLPPADAPSSEVELDPADLDALLLRLRGALCRRKRVVLRVDRRGRPVADRSDVQAVAAAGVATADHMLRMGPWAAVLGRDDGVTAVVDEFEDRYQEYFARQKAAVPEGFGMHDPAPRAVLVPGLGTVSSGRDERAASVVADVVAHSTAVAARAIDAFGAAATMSEEEIFAVDYWPLELYKLTLAPPPPELAGHVVCVTGAASGIGREVAVHLSRLGAILVAGDLDGDGLAAMADQLEAEGRCRPELTVGDVSEEAVVEAMVSAGVRRFGGIDGFVVNAGIAPSARLLDLTLAEWRRVMDVNLTSAMLLTRAALRVLATQGIGGSLVYIASKNAFAPGAGFAAYSASKAGMVQLMRIAAIEGGSIGVRANAVNPDAVFEGSRLWSADVRHERAAAHGVGETELEAYYASRNVLGSTISAAHVAHAAAYLLSERSSRTTGTVLPVDGGVPAAFPR